MALPEAFGCGPLPQRVCTRCQAELPAVDDGSRLTHYERLGVPSDVTLAQLEFVHAELQHELQCTCPRGAALNGYTGSSGSAVTSAQLVCGPILDRSSASRLS